MCSEATGIAHLMHQWVFTTGVPAKAGKKAKINCPPELNITNSTVKRYYGRRGRNILGWCKKTKKATEQMQELGGKYELR